jgi:zinc transporter, ZIP family
VTFTRTVLLGFVAGATIIIGLLLGRMKRAAPRLRLFLMTSAIGVLLFLLVDVLSHAVSPINEAMAAAHGHGALTTIVWRSLLLGLGTAAGLLGLVAYDGWSAARRAAAGLSEANPDGVATRLSTMIALGIGLHNFGEGLAIGSSARSGAIGLSTVLVIGFALHNATEGFGIVAPLAQRSSRVSWSFLLLMALIGGGPTTLGTLVGWRWSSPTLNVLFFALAGGSILYVVIQLLGVAQRAKASRVLYLGVLSGLLLGFGTDLLVTWAGG